MSVPFMENGNVNPSWAKEKADELRKTSVCILKNIIPVELVDSWNEQFQPLLEDAIRNEKDDPNRGPNRYYVTLPFNKFWANPEILDHPLIMAIVTELVGNNGMLCQLATDTPVLGSAFQDLHRDTRVTLFPELGENIPPYQLAVNFPLVDCLEGMDNGPFELAKCTQNLEKNDALEKIANGEIEVKPVYLARGDVMIRDVRHIHRGSPNNTSTPRPMVVIGYSPSWLFRPEVEIRVPRTVLDGLPERTRQWLRHNPVFETEEEAAQIKEIYRAFAY